MTVIRYMRPITAIAALSGLAPMAVQAQASLKCQVQPKTFAAMHDCYRPLLVFSPTGNNAELRDQVNLLDHDADDMMDRFVLLTPVLADSHGYQPPLDAPHALLNSKEMAGLRHRYHVPDSDFLVLLLGEDGSVKLRDSHPVSTERLNSLIDAMPMRKVEEKRKDAY